MWFVGLILLAVAGGLYYGHRSKLRRLGRIVSTETVTTEHLRTLAASMAEGFGSGSLRLPAAVSGRIVCPEPLVSELAEVPSVYYSMSVQREYEEESHGDEKNRGPQRRSERLAHQERSVAFEVRDSTGSIAVEPAGAKFIAESTLSRFDPASAGAQTLEAGRFSLEIPAPPSSSKTLGYRFEETAIPADRDVYVLGDVTDAGGELGIETPENDGEFLISLKGRSQLVRELGSGARGLKIAAIVCAVLGLVLVIL